MDIEEPLGSFADKFADWEFTHSRNHAGLEKQLAQEYRMAWEPGDAEDRCAVLSVVLFIKDPNSFDLVRKGLHDDNEEVSHHAAAVATALILKGYDLGSGVRRELEDFGRRFPDRAILVTPALRRLGSKDS